MKEPVKIVNQSPPFLFLFTLVLLVCKLSGLNDIGWLWVFSPLWIPILVALSVLILVGIFIFIGVSINRYRDSKDRKRHK